MRFSYLLAALPALAAADQLNKLSASSSHTAHKALLMGRQSSSECPSGQDVCGIYCIIDTYTCCPDLGGGCSTSEYCAMGDNGQYGCCDIGKTCSGDGGTTITGSDDDESSSGSSSGSGSGSSSGSSSGSGSGSSSGTKPPGGGAGAIVPQVAGAMAAVGGLVAALL